MFGAKALTAVDDIDIGASGDAFQEPPKKNSPSRDIPYEETPKGKFNKAGQIFLRT